MCLVLADRGPVHCSNSSMFLRCIHGADLLGGELLHTLSLWTVTGRTRLNIGTRNSLFAQFLSSGNQFQWSASKGLGIEIPKMGDKGRYHRGAQSARNTPRRCSTNWRDTDHCF